MFYSTRSHITAGVTLWLVTMLVTLGHVSVPTANHVAVDFENVELRIFIKFVSEATGRIFLLDDRVRGQVSVRFTNMIPIDQLPDVLDSVLELKGFTAVPSGPITKIVPLANARQRGIEVNSSSSAVGGYRR